MGKQVLIDDDSYLEQWAQDLLVAAHQQDQDDE